MMMMKKTKMHLWPVVVVVLGVVGVVVVIGVNDEREHDLYDD